jgi:ribosomal protein L40E
MQNVEAENVIYEYFANEELLSELEVVAKQAEILANQLEKLLELHSQGKIKDAIYRELREDLRRKSRFVSESRDLLGTAVVSRIHLVNLSASRLRHRLESLEIRKSVGTVSEEDYPSIKNELFNKAVEAEDAAMHMMKLKDSMDEAFKKIDRCLAESELPNPVEPIAELPAHVAEEPSKMKSCPNCGAMNDTNANLCVECGENLIIPPQNFGRQNGEVKMVTPAPVPAPTPAPVTAPAPTPATTNGQLSIEQLKNGPEETEEKPFPPAERVVYLNTIICPRCGADNLAKAMYCFRCKAKLVQNRAQ